MTIGEIIIVIIVWNVIGVLPCALWGVAAYTDGWELCNPYWAHWYYKVNWFGAIMLSLLYTIICPIGAVCYWFYKLCTVGRR